MQERKHLGNTFFWPLMIRFDPPMESSASVFRPRTSDPASGSVMASAILDFPERTSFTTLLWISTAYKR